MQLNTRASALTETSKLYTDRWTGRAILEYPLKHSFCRGVTTLNTYYGSYLNLLTLLWMTKF